MDKLKPCPFCGCVPTVEWENWSEISPTSGAWRLYANHDGMCFIRKMDGLNILGRITSFNKERIIEMWNRRADNGLD